MRYSIIEGQDMPYAEVMTEKEFLADYGELSLLRPFSSQI